MELTALNMFNTLNVPNISIDNNTHDIKMINKLFIEVNYEFLNQGWKLDKNTLTEISYVNPIYPTDEFKIQIKNKLIKVTVPVLGANYEYSTSFSSYFQASEFLLLHLNDHLTHTFYNY